MTDIQKQILIKAAKIRKDRGEDIAVVFNQYKNLTDEEKADILAEFEVTPLAKDLNVAKEEKIALSKTMLAEYIEKNPLITDCHGGRIGTYTITEDKQTMFTSKFTAHMALVQAGIPDTMTWNETGKPCEVWTDEECIAFIAQWSNITTSLVKYQQDTEVGVGNCQTVDEVNAIVIDYASADPRNQ